MPTDVSEEETTPIPRVLLDNTEVPLILNTLLVDIFVSPATSRVYAGFPTASPMLTLPLVVSAFKIA